MLDVLIAATNGQMIHISAHNSLMEWHDTYYGISEDGKTAFIEMASISGLPLVPPEKRNPMLTTTYGTGELIRKHWNAVAATLSLASVAVQQMMPDLECFRH